MCLREAVPTKLPEAAKRNGLRGFLKWVPQFCKLLCSMIANCFLLICCSFTFPFDGVSPSQVELVLERAVLPDLHQVSPYRQNVHISALCRDEDRMASNLVHILEDARRDQKQRQTARRYIPLRQNHERKTIKKMLFTTRESRLNKDTNTSNRCLKNRHKIFRFSPCEPLYCPQQHFHCVINFWELSSAAI